MSRVAVVALGAACLLAPGDAYGAADPAEDGRPAVRVFTDRDGLPQNSIFSIARDCRGYIWVSTRDGAARYNGRTWTPVAMPQSEQSSLVWSVLAASDCSIWFGRHGGGVSRLRDGAFTSWGVAQGLPSGQVYAVLEAVSADGGSVLWAGTEKGLARFDGSGWKAADVPPELRGQPVLSLLATREAGMDVLWVGSAAGLGRHDAAGWTWYDARSGLPRAAVRSLLRVERDGRSELWAGTEGAGVARLAGGSWTVFGRESGLENLTVYALLESRGPDGVSRVWAGTYGGGLARWDGTRWAHSADVLPSNVVKSLLDTSAPGGPQILWAGTETGGLARLERGSFVGLESKAVPLGGSIYALLETEDGGAPTYWVGAYTDGVMRFRAGAWSSLATPMPSRLVSSLAETRDADGAKSLWVGTFGGGLGRLARERWTLFDTVSGLPHNRITKLLPSRTPGRLWVGTYGGGLACWENGRWERYDSRSGLPSDRVQSILETPARDGGVTLWVGTEFGLARLEGGRWTVYNTSSGLPNDLVVSLMLENGPAGREILWAGTLGGGVARLDLSQPGARFTAPRLSSPLASNAIYQIRGDARGRVYLFTSRGVARLTPRQATPEDRAEYLLRTFTTEDGLPSNECNFNATMTDSLGRLWVGTSHGVGVLDPSLNVDDTAKKPLWIEQVQQGSRTLSEAQARDLGYRQNGLEFYLALLSYSHDAETAYRSQLVGFDAEPSAWTRDHKRTYTNLPAGSFTFTAWGRDAAGNVSGPITFPVHIRAAPWRTPWAYAAYVVALLALGFSAQRLRVRALERRNRDLEERVRQGTQDLAGKVTQLQASEKLAQELAEKAQDASRAKSVFLASMSHELRTPLSAVIGFAQVLERDTRLSGQNREEVGIIHRSGEHLLGLINDVLSLSKIEAGSLSLQERPFDLQGMLASVQGMVRARADAKDLDLIFDLAPGLPERVKGDEGRLRQVLLNLLGNAVKFTSRGQVALRARGAGGRIRFAIEDTGPGIAEADLARLFRPFSQTETGLVSQEGTGLGLVISRQIVRLMGGDIEVTSRVGAGTTFSFEVALPPTDEPLPERQRREVLGLAPGQDSVRVLVVDDAVENRLLLTRLLESAGFEVREAVNGREAVEETERFRPHVVFLDKRMPVMDGPEAARRIRAGDARRDTKIVFLTASAFEHETDDLLATGADAVLPKPFRIGDVFETIGALVNVKYREAAGADELPAPVSASTPGFNVAAGLRRAGGNQELYRRLVTDLLADLPGVLPRLRSAADAAAFSAELHRVRGAAANLGAQTLAGAAARLERLAADGVTGGALTEGPELEALARAIEELLGGAPEPAPARAATPEPGRRDARLDRERARLVLPLARRVARELAESNMAAISGVEELCAALGPALARERRELQACAQRLDFEASAALVAVIAAEAARAGGEEGP